MSTPSGRRAPRLTALYDNRFTAADLEYKRKLWAVLCRDFFGAFVDRSAVVLDLGAGSCEFINAIECRRKLAVDLDPRVSEFARGAEVFVVPSTDMHPIDDATVDVVFCSNFFEHLTTKDELMRTLDECRRVLRPGGRIIVLQPNVRYLPGRFWDYLDHHLPLTHLSLQEALRLAGFEIEEVVARFLPYTVKSRLAPRALLLVRLYLRLRILWPLFGRQMLVVAERV